MDVPVLNYLHTDKNEQGEDTPRGEIWLKGENVIPGYYLRDDKYKENFYDGWCKTGDIGEITPNMALKIIDRKKNIFKLSQGEYIAPEKLEGVYKAVSNFISTVMVYGDSL